MILVERDSNAIGKGLAFGTRRPEHLLNVRAANMSAFPDDPAHFLKWMGFSSDDQMNRFVPRLAYGQYLKEQLMSAISAATGRIHVVPDTAVALDLSGPRPVVQFSRDASVSASAVVLAAGNFPPSIPDWAQKFASANVITDPWSGSALDSVDQNDRVVIVGTGLTAVDVITSLISRDHQGPITAISRRGLVPREHARAGPITTVVPIPNERGSSLVRAVRRRARQIGWQAAIDELRPHTQALWRAHDVPAQARLLRHLRPFWDVHRHRLAPTVGEQLARLSASGRLRFVAGQVTELREENCGLLLEYRPRGGDAICGVEADVIINCTGPAGDITKVPNALLRHLSDQGHARPDAHRLGLAVDENLRLIDRKGQPVTAVYALGPLTRGGIWEMIAVPDIRVQAWKLARQIAGKSVANIANAYK